MAKILILHGPNLNMLGQREPGLYGNQSLSDINDSLENFASSLGYTLDVLQSNAEHELINKVQSAKSDKIDFIVINPAAYTHSSVALRVVGGSDSVYRSSLIKRVCERTFSETLIFFRHCRWRYKWFRRKRL